MKTVKNSADAETREQIKQRIIKLFNENVKGKIPDSSASNLGHDGKEGHWLEKQMGIAHNASNTPDLFGFEMKNDTSSKTTFGDWSADYYIFKDKKFNITRDEFLSIFGSPNSLKENRYSWSGKPTPKIRKYNSYGQKLKIDLSCNICATYSFKKDGRQDKAKIVPKSMQKNNLIIAEWSAAMMKKRVESKFNNLGWFKCYKDKNTGAYTRIAFGPPIRFSSWIKGVKKGLIYFDSGMYQGNVRPYSQWRADNKYWDSLITDRY